MGKKAIRTFLTLAVWAVAGLSIGCSSKAAKPSAKDAGAKKSANARDAGADTGSSGSAGQGSTNPGPTTKTGMPDASIVEAMASFRVTELELRDPHLFALGSDITDTPLLGMSVNGTLIADGLNKDYDGDGFLDVSAIGTLTPFDPTSKSAQLELTDAHCPVEDPVHCVADPQPTLNATFTVENHASGNCLEPAADTLSNFMPKISLPAAPCFITTDPMDIMIDVGGIDVAMTSTRIAASYDTKPPGQLINGVIAGFVSVDNAMKAVLPDSVGAPLAGTPISDYLRAQDRDKAQSPNGQDGWWVYFNFTAKPVGYIP